MSDKIYHQVYINEAFFYVEEGRLKPIGNNTKSLLNYYGHNGDRETYNIIHELLEKLTDVNYDMLHIHLAELGIFKLPMSLAGKSVSVSTAHNMRTVASFLSRED